MSIKKILIDLAIAGVVTVAVSAVSCSNSTRTQAPPSETVRAKCHEGDAGCWTWAPPPRLAPNDGIRT